MPCSGQCLCFLHSPLAVKLCRAEPLFWAVKLCRAEPVLWALGLRSLPSRGVYGHGFNCQPVNSGSTLEWPQSCVKCLAWYNPNFIGNKTRGCCITLFFAHVPPELCCENTTKFVCVAVNQFYNFILEIFHLSRKIFCICPPRSLLSPWFTLLLYWNSQRAPESLNFLVMCLWILKSEQGKQLRQEQGAWSISWKWQRGRTELCYEWITE